MERILYAAAAIVAVTAVVNLIARRLEVPSPILLVIAGAVISFIPGAPHILLPPNLVLLVFLPPLIYYAAFGMSWQAFCRNLRPIVLLAVGCVIFTTVTVAAAAHWLIGLSWPVAFILGAIISPPDVVAPLAIARRLGLPSRIREVLEGEGLVNDATALVLFKFALAAALTGMFSLVEATVSFTAIVAGETVYGLLIGWLTLRLRYYARDPLVEVTLSLLTPFIAFWLPHALGGSGVLATVVAGLYVGFKGVELIRSNTRLQALFFWEFVTYLIEGSIFLLTGLQAHAVMEGLGAMQWGELLLYAAAISGVTILVRFLWVFPGIYLPRWLFPTIQQRYPPPPWQHAFFVAFTGIRGVVSLAAALSIPLFIGDQPFPARDLVLFLTFSVIVVTLVLQGPILPWLVARLGLVDSGAAELRQREQSEEQARIEGAQAALDRLEKLVTVAGLGEDVVRRLRELQLERVDRLLHRRDREGEGALLAAKLDELELAVIQTERDTINRSLREGKITDETRRHIERDLDLREEAIRRGVRSYETSD